MQLNCKALLWDLDGTLMDTAPDLISACNHTLTSFGLKALNPGLIRTRVTSGMRAMLSLGVPESERSGYDIEGQMRKTFAEYYTAHINIFTKPFEGIVELCDAAKASGLPMAVITSKYEAMALKLFENYPFTADFKVLLGCDSLPWSKPDPRPLWEALKRLEVSPEDALYVGDHLNDIRAARNAGVRSAAALWGYGQSECGPAENWGADLLVESPGALCRLLGLDA